MSGKTDEQKAEEIAAVTLATFLGMFSTENANEATRALALKRLRELLGEWEAARGG